MQTNETASQLWAAALGQLQIEIPRPNFETWLKDTQAVSLESETLLVVTPSAFAAEMLERRLASTIARAVERVAKRPLAVEFQVAGPRPVLNDPTAAQAADAHRGTVAQPSDRLGAALRPGLTFETSDLKPPRGSGK